LSDLTGGMLVCLTDVTTKSLRKLIPNAKCVHNSNRNDDLVCRAQLRDSRRLRRVTGQAVPCNTGEFLPISVLMDYAGRDAVIAQAGFRGERSGDDWIGGGLQGRDPKIFVHIGFVTET
jgi:hypothetical protein